MGGVYERLLEVIMKKLYVVILSLFLSQSCLANDEQKLAELASSIEDAISKASTSMYKMSASMSEPMPNLPSLPNGVELLAKAAAGSEAANSTTGAVVGGASGMAKFLPNFNTDTILEAMASNPKVASALAGAIALGGYYYWTKAERDNNSLMRGTNSHPYPTVRIIYDADRRGGRGNVGNFVKSLMSDDTNLTTTEKSLQPALRDILGQLNKKIKEEKDKFEKFCQNYRIVDLPDLKGITDITDSNINRFIKDNKLRDNHKTRNAIICRLLQEALKRSEDLIFQYSGGPFGAAQVQQAALRRPAMAGGSAAGTGGTYIDEVDNDDDEGEPFVERGRPTQPQRRQLLDRGLRDVGRYATR
jgi:hypothetical protein